MKENYYDILEINKNASPEIVEKAYKTLAKKYHPDLQEGSIKKEYEEKLKLINEAYEILSNEEKRQKYNQKLEQEALNNAQKGNIMYDDLQNNQNNSSAINVDKIEVDKNIKERMKQAKQQAEYEKKYKKQVNDAINRAYYNAYVQSLRKRGFKIKYKKSIKDYLRGFIAIIISIVILIILWHIPFVKNYFIKLYNENSIIHSTVNVFWYIIKSFKV